MLCYARDGDGNLPIHLAANDYYGSATESLNKPQIVDVLLQHDAKYATAPNSASPVSHQSMVLTQNMRGDTPLHEAAFSNQSSAIVQRILDYERTLGRTQVKRMALDTELGRRAYLPQTSILYMRDHDGLIPAHYAVGDDP